MGLVLNANEKEKYPTILNGHSLGLRGRIPQISCVLMLNSILITETHVGE